MNPDPKSSHNSQIRHAIDVALIHHRSGNLAEAEKIYREVLSSQPNQTDALHLLGVIYGQRGQPEIAVEMIGRAIHFRPEVPDYHANLGEYLRRAGKLDESAASFRHAIGMKGDDAGFHNGLGAALAEMREIEGAVAEFRRAVALKGNYAEALNNLGGALRENGQLTEALAAVREAIRLEPRMFGAFNHLGLILHDMGEYREAINAYCAAISLKPDYPKAHSNLSQPYLMLGDYPHGWAEFEWRLSVPAIVGVRKFNRPRWNGGDLSGKKILLHPEQGFGDLIQFVRFIPELIGRGANIIFESPAELGRLFRGFGEIIVPGQLIPEHDLHCPLLSLGYVLKITTDSIPAPIPYLKADPNLAEPWAGRFDQRDKRLRVGLIWKGRPTHTNDGNRSMKPGQFASLASVSNTAFYSLQKSIGSTSTREVPPDLQLTNWTDELQDFADTAALLQNLDLLITVDTATAHLAGAMGKSVWLLLPFVPDWRWMLDRTDSPWYPTMRLFRQKSPGDWADVMQRVEEALSELASRHATAK